MGLLYLVIQVSWNKKYTGKVCYVYTPCINVREEKPTKCREGHWALLFPLFVGVSAALTPPKTNMSPKKTPKEKIRKGSCSNPQLLEGTFVSSPGRAVFYLNMFPPTCHFPAGFKWLRSGALGPWIRWFGTSRSLEKTSVLKTSCC